MNGLIDLILRLACVSWPTCYETKWALRKATQKFLLVPKITDKSKMEKMSNRSEEGKKSASDLGRAHLTL